MCCSGLRISTRGPVTDVGRRDVALALDSMRAVSRHVVVQLDAHLLQVEDDVGDVLAHTRQRRELVQDALDAHRGDRRALQRRQQDPPQRVADGGAEAALERLADELAVGRRRGSSRRPRAASA